MYQRSRHRKNRIQNRSALCRVGDREDKDHGLRLVSADCRPGLRAGKVLDSWGIVQSVGALGDCEKFKGNQGFGKSKMQLS